MGGSASSKVKISIGNAYSETVWAYVSREIERTNCFIQEENSTGNWYQRQRGYQRIGPSSVVTFDMDLPRNTSLVYISVGSDTGMQISDCLPKHASDRNLIVTAEGSVVDGKLASRWEDEDGKCHQPQNQLGGRAPSLSGKAKARLKPSLYKGCRKVDFIYVYHTRKERIGTSL